MKLQDTLDTMREKLEAGLPLETKAVMHRAVDGSADAVIMDKVLRQGGLMLHFTLLYHR